MGRPSHLGRDRAARWGTGSADPGGREESAASRCLAQRLYVRESSGLTIVSIAAPTIQRGLQEDTDAAGTALSRELPDEDPGADFDPAWR